MTLIHGMTDGEMTALVERLTVASSAETAAEVFARIAWSGIAEPGDRVAGLLITALGARLALNALIEGRAVNRIVDNVLTSSSGASEGLEDASASSLRELVDDGLNRWRPRLSCPDVAAHIARGVNVKAGVITPLDEDWPLALDDLGLHRPALLWFRGRRERVGLARDAVSIVGARASTGYGEHVTMEVATELAERHVTVVSGAAYGIDGMAHRAALAGEGLTMAVLAGGIDRLYPSGHHTLLRRIVDVGIVMSELPCGFAPTKWRFLQRNRLIAALGRATVVVEAGWRSGSLNTANHALELGRPVGAVPGPVTSAASAGCHRLLRETPAVCVTTADEVIALAGITRRAPGEPGGSEATRVDGDEGGGAQESLEPEVVRLCDALAERRPRDLDELARSSGMSHGDVRSSLGIAALRGLVRETPQGWVRVRHAPRS